MGIDTRLRYVSDDRPGIQRRRAGRGFCYVDNQGRAVHDRKTLQRIRALVIPPAWTNVWICPFANGHIQAVGRDARGRKQYRYHVGWSAARDAEKFSGLAHFAKVLPRIHRRVRRDLALQGLPRLKVLASLVRLLETTLIRVGNDEYAKQNGSYGLTTFQNRHAHVKGATIEFRFRGKSGILHEVVLEDKRLAKLIKRIQDLPGQELFQYLDERGRPHGVDSADLNAYLREISGEDFTAKDFRTWAGTLSALRFLLSQEMPATVSRRKKLLTETIRQVAQQLRNTVAVCRKSYIHPAVLTSYLEGESTWNSLPQPPRRNLSISSTVQFLRRLLRTQRGTKSRT